MVSIKSFVRRSINLTIIPLSFKKSFRFQTSSAFEHNFLSLIDTNSSAIIHIRIRVWPKTTVGTKSVFGEWCNGSTTDSESVSQGSNPCSPGPNLAVLLICWPI